MERPRRRPSISSVRLEVTRQASYPERPDEKAGRHARRPGPPTARAARMPLLIQSLPIPDLTGLQWGAIVASYLLGAIPFGLLIVKVVSGVDVRTVGSENIGTTNAMRAGGRKIGFLVFAFDFAKGFFPARVLAPLVMTESGPSWLPLACGAAAVVGHCYPVYLGFRGGKGVATYVGAILAIDPVIFLVGGLAYLATLTTTRYAGLASIVMASVFHLTSWFRAGESRHDLIVATALLTLLIVLRHRSNMARMLSGKEPKVLTRS